MSIYKKVAKIIVIAFIFLTFTNIFCNTSHAIEDFEVKVSIGFNGYYKLGKVIPLKVEVKNNYKDIDGKVQVFFRTPRGNDSLYTFYSKKLNISKGTTKEINMNVLLNEHYIYNLLKVRIIDNDGQFLWEDEVNVGPLKVMDTGAIGIISDDYDSLRYFSNLYYKIMNGEKRFYYILNLNNLLPENTYMLESFDVLVINNYNTEKFSTNQVLAIKNWVKRGGTLIIGTGPNYQQTLKGLESIQDIDVLERDKTNRFFNYKSEIPLEIAKLKIDGAKKQNNELIYKKKIGKGNIIVTAFDLGLKPFTEFNRRNEVMNNIVNESIGIKNLIKYESKGPTSIYNTEYLVGYVPKDRLPSFKLVIGIISIFIIMVGPLNYIILKRLDKREFGWVTVPIIVLVFSSLIYFWGTSTQFRASIVNSVNVINVKPDADIAEIESTIGIMPFKKGDIDVSLSDDIYISHDNNMYRYQSANLQDGDIILENYQGKENHLVFRESGLWDVKTISLKKFINLNNGIQQDITFSEDRLIGTIKNLTDMDVEDAVLIYGDSFEKIGDIKKGATKNINVQLTGTKSQINKIKSYHYLITKLYPYNGTQQGNQDNKIDIRTKRRILEQYYETKRNDMEDIMIIGWNTKPLIKEIKVNGAYANRNVKSLVVIPVEVKYEKGQEVKIPYGMLEPKIVDVTNLTYDDRMKQFFGEGEVVLSYKLNTDIKLNKMTIDLGSANITRNENVYVYNYKTDKWDKYDSRMIVIDSENKEVYYNNSEGTKVTIAIDGRKDRILIPEFSVEGVVR
ncbi:hypothetical protein [Thermohalobacter berrensis]|uniref:Uncharacterized protein n=1 Tax=Thermohalobacter berrensis TaxID=99594 RepID=A0A419SZB4_9FIRM|nr:hypothetical protein [Thermohalobacter berrensis]RKD30546.1 hypothetical protein BET03_04200 [Thermohalobacter berrensis]